VLAEVGEPRREGVGGGEGGSRSGEDELAQVERAAERVEVFGAEDLGEGAGALFAASSGAIKALATDPRHIGGDVPGFFGVLHTWGHTLQYHPTSTTSSWAAR